MLTNSACFLFGCLSLEHCSGNVYIFLSVCCFLSKVLLRRRLSDSKINVKSSMEKSLLRKRLPLVLCPLQAVSRGACPVGGTLSSGCFTPHSLRGWEGQTSVENLWLAEVGTQNLRPGKGHGHPLSCSGLRDFLSGVGVLISPSIAGT